MLNSKKLAILLTGLCSVVMAAAGSLVPVAHATSGGSTPCYDITDQGSPVLVGGVANSGTILFDKSGTPPGPDTQYEACVTDPENDGKGMFDVKGWAWDDNLAWVSFFCGDENGDGPPYENLGISCGNQMYGVQMAGTDQPNSGRFSGYAYGDNTGWINFSCAGSGGCGLYEYYVEAETSQEACLGEVFSSAPPGTCNARPIKSTFAFSDNVGWFNLAGAQFPWIQLISAAVNVNFEILMLDGVTPLGSTVLDKKNSAVADGTDGYILRLHITKLDGTAIDPSKYAVTANVVWNTDTVNVDQTDPVSVECKENLDPACSSADAVSKPLSFSDFTYNSATSSFDSKVTSVAPTSGVNGYDKNDDGIVDFSYEQFVLGGPGYLVPSNLLQLGDVKVSVMASDTQICAFGDVFTGCIPKSVLNPTPRTLEFLPPIELNELKDLVNDFAMTARSVVANTLNYSTVCRGALSDCSTDSPSIKLETGVSDPFVLVLGSGCTDPQTFGISSHIPWSSTVSSFQIMPVFKSDPVTDLCLTSGPSTGDDAYIRSTASYTATGGKAVKYYSNKLPRVKGSLVVNPVAEIRGSVYSTGVTNPLTGKTVRSIGDVSTNILRNTLYQNVKNMVAGHAVTSGNATLSLSVAGAFSVNPSNIGAGLLPDVNGPTVYYFNGGNVTIGDKTSSSNITWKGNRTIIVEGGDVYIHQDLYNSSVVTPKPKLGLIVFKDLITGKGGNVYISPNVKNIQANIFADGSVFSYDPAHGILPNGEPRFPDEAGRYNALLNQLYIEGSLASQNTIGGAVAIPKPILGDGQLADAGEGSYGDNPTGRSKARLYDLNFLRYYGLVFARHTAETNPACIGDAIDKQHPTLCPTEAGYSLLAKPSIGPDSDSDGDLVLNPGGSPAQGLVPTTNLSAVYISFDPPPATLPGFGVSSGVLQTVRPQ